ncbi:SHOCT domain-containing protein [Halobaculum litoreum]|uniref:SHOCT domain-containing protein n=1 Tax=Halobaculum litoreum TaxID=3031998 RepID=A0ABD5XNA6_9EURY
MLDCRSRRYESSTERGRARTARDSGTRLDSSVDATDDPVTTLQRRYAAGELSDEEFDRRLETVLETDAVAQSPDGAQPITGPANREVEHETAGR